MYDIFNWCDCICQTATCMTKIPINISPLFIPVIVTCKIQNVPQLNASVPKCGLNVLTQFTRSLTGEDRQREQYLQKHSGGSQTAGAPTASV